MVRFLLNDTPVTLSTADANQTVLQFLRETKGLTGTKEGCAAGDCGACTVVLAAPTAHGTALHYTPINSCIALLSSLHRKQLICVEHLSRGSRLHPVQQALVEHHGSQCGFCTPGFVMSMFALYHAPGTVQREDVMQALSGNLCRCTGYRPIIDAALSVCAKPPTDHFYTQQPDTLRALQALHNSSGTALTEEQHNPGLQGPGLLMPTNRQELRQCIADYPDAPLVAGSTDMSLTITQQLQQYSTLISLSQMQELKFIHCTSAGIAIGAACTLDELHRLVCQHYPTLSELTERFASLPVRHQATLGGNLVNASPIGDLPPVMLALNARFIIDNGREQHSLEARAFYTGYRETALPAGFWLSHIELPLLKPDQHLAAYKVSKRFEDDISAVCAVFLVSIDKHHNITALATGFGGVAATPIAATDFEQRLPGHSMQDALALTQAKQWLASAFTPIDDVRASALYRQQLLANLWHRFVLQYQNQHHVIATRVRYHA
ncbi:xanthine dehydrogenase small subunit [Salinimonas marina]|uniref:Xanthine dehydrogenase small subunit n=1 Tax=Salinimonas marina TaxID=2785918 RepID=A0A7S9DVM6_9ALTE|nr:xanthine dehydrogenase small subunit [Salinimonas marina]QPG04593.1 xanthine dehydrogenase small subunit [Salinimonas marina]